MNGKVKEKAIILLKKDPTDSDYLTNMYLGFQRNPCVDGCVGLFLYVTLRCHPSSVRSLAYRLVYRRLFPALASLDDAVTWQAEKEQPGQSQSFVKHLSVRVYIKSDSGRYRTHLCDHQEQTQLGERRT